MKIRKALKPSGVLCIGIVIAAVFGFYFQNNERSFDRYDIIYTEQGTASTDVYAKDGDLILPDELLDGNTESDNSNTDKLYININTDKVYELDALYGIGEKMAMRIIEYRQKHGDFEVIEDLMRVSGIGKKKFDKIKDNIYVE